MKVYESLVFAQAIRSGKVLFSKEEVQILESAIRDDAAIIADLLEALKELLGDFAQLIEYYNEERTADAWDAVTIDEMSNGAIKARAAIAKATGVEE